MVPDGSDTNAYGEECEPGYGYTVQSGFLDPDWTRWEVHGEREEVRPDEWTPEDGPLIEWLVARIGERLGWVEVNGGGSFYAAEAEQNPATGVSCRVAAHVHGASDAVVAAVGYALAFGQRPAALVG